MGQYTANAVAVAAVITETVGLLRRVSERIDALTVSHDILDAMIGRLHAEQAKLRTAGDATQTPPADA